MQFEKNFYTIESKTKERIISFDFLRIFAALAVIIMHIPSLGVPIFNAFSRFAVPIFFMMSGALMLDESKNITFKIIFKKIFNFVVMLFVWNFIYALSFGILLPIYYNKQISLSGVFKQLVLGNYHLWFLYALIGLYLITPILRLFVKKENISCLLYLVLLAVIFTFLPQTINIISNKFLPISLHNVFYDFIKNFSLTEYFGYVTYYILGWIVLNFPIKKTFRIFIYVCGLIGCSIIIITLMKIKANNFFLDNLQIFNFSYSLSIFVFIFYLLKDKKVNSKFNKFVIKLSSLTFGVYLIHDLIIQFILLFVIKGIIVNLYITFLLKFLIASISSFVICYLISLIPYFKKIIRG